MFWVVQNNLYNEAGYVRFIEALDRLRVDYLVVTPIPFTNQFLPADFDSMTQEVDDVEEPFIDTNQKIIVMGATTLSRVAKSRGWTPGTYLNENFDFSKWRDGFGKNNILNGDARVGLVKNITIPPYDYVFVRPVHDNKSFSGEVMSIDALHEWLKDISKIEEIDEFLLLHKNTEIMISSAKNIISEYRMFIVNGKVVTGSLYKRGNQVISDEYVEPQVYAFCERMIDEWQSKIDCKIIPDTRVPADAFVMDVAVTAFGMKVIEINNINSAGFYAADCQKIVAALEDLENHGRTRGYGVEI